MVFKLISLFSARCVTQSFVTKSFYTNFSIVTKKCGTKFGLQWFLHELQYFEQGVGHRVWFRMVFAQISVF